MPTIQTDHDQTFTGGQVVQDVQRQVDITADVNRADLLARAAAAIQANQTFLAIGAPTNAQVTTQVKALTRQVDALLRLAAGLLDDTAGT